jgi:hypothetical protein
VTAPDQTDLAAALALAAQLQSNADAHQESDGTERRRSAEQIEALVSELNALYPRWSAMTSERSDWQIRALDAENQLAEAHSMIAAALDHEAELGEVAMCSHVRSALTKEES